MEIAQAMGERFEERKAELEAAGEWLANKRLVKFSFGNTHEEVKDPKPSRTNAQLKNSHRWCMFMSMSNDVEQTSKFVKSVTYHLHPTFKPSKIKVEEAPFLLSRVGWGYFGIEMDVEFKPSTGLGTKKLNHMLDFEGAGKTQSFLLEVNSEDSQSLAVALAAQIDKLNIN